MPSTETAEACRCYAAPPHLLPVDVAIEGVASSIGTASRMVPGTHVDPKRQHRPGWQRSWVLRLGLLRSGAQSQTNLGAEERPLLIRLATGATFEWHCTAAPSRNMFLGRSRERGPRLKCSINASLASKIPRQPRSSSRRRRRYRGATSGEHGLLQQPSLFGQPHDQVHVLQRLPAGALQQPDFNIRILS